MTRSTAIANLKIQIAVNGQFPHAADMVARQIARLARLEGMSDDEFNVEQAKALDASVRSMARSLRHI